MSFFRKYKSELTAAGAILLFYSLLFLLGITCPIKYITGISCAGCGMSRAWFSLFRLDIAGAVAYHPLFWTPPLAAAAFFLKKRYPLLFKVVLSIVIGLFILVYFVRMFDCDCTVVVFEPKNSLFYRIVQKFT